MKLLVCVSCGDMNTLHHRVKQCECGKTGGSYNDDGDTATIWGTEKFGKLFGLNNRAIYRAAVGVSLSEFEGDNVLWPYPMDNGKITVVEAPGGSAGVLAVAGAPHGAEH